MFGFPDDLDLQPADLPFVLSGISRHLGPHLEPLCAWLADPTTIGKADATHSKQHWWGLKWHEASAKALLTTLSARDKTRFAFQRDQRGGPWLGVAPCRALGTEIPNDEFRALGKYWLGAPLIEVGGVACMPEVWQPERYPGGPHG